MHELSLMTAIMEIAQKEMDSHGASKLKKIIVRYGILDQVMPEAMNLAFEVMVHGTEHEGAVMELMEEPLTLQCNMCGHIFTTEEKANMFEPCPSCGDFFPYTVKGGEGIFLDHLEAE